MVRAVLTEHDGPLNIVGSDAASPWQAVRLGGRIPLPVAPLLWGWAARVVDFAGSAIAPHVVELLRYGCTGSGQRRGRGARPRAAASDAAGAHRALRVGRHRLRSPRPGPSHDSGPDQTERRARSRSHVRSRTAPLDALRRRLGGRYPIDPFGLDPQLCDAGAPIVEALVRVRVEGADRRPRHRTRGVRDESRPRCPRADRARARGAPPGRPAAARRRHARRPVRRRPAAPARFGERLARRSRRVPARRPPRRGAARADVVALRSGHAAVAVGAGDDGLDGPARRGDARRALRHRDRAVADARSASTSRSTPRTRPAIRSARPSSPRGARRGRRPARPARNPPTSRVRPWAWPPAEPRSSRTLGQAAGHAASTLASRSGGLGGSRAGGRDVPEVIASDGSTDRVRRLRPSRRLAGADDPGPRAPTHGVGRSSGGASGAAIAASHPTTGASAAPTSRRARTRCSRWREDALACLDAEGIETAHVMGASMGGVIAQIIATLAPERVARSCSRARRAGTTSGGASCSPTGRRKCRSTGWARCPATRSRGSSAPHPAPVRCPAQRARTGRAAVGARAVRRAGRGDPRDTRRDARGARAHPRAHAHHHRLPGRAHSRR